MGETERWELVENYGGNEEPQVVGRYTDEGRAKRACMAVNLASAPVDADDIWGPDYFVRRADAS